MSRSQAAVASGSGLRRWTWSQVTMGIVISLAILAGLMLAAHVHAPNLTAGFLQFHPSRALGALLPSRNETILDVSVVSEVAPPCSGSRP